MIIRLLFLFWTFFAGQPGTVATKAATAVPLLGFYVINLSDLSAARPAVDKVRAGLSELPVRLVATTELKSLLREDDSKQGLLDRAGKLLAQGRELHLGMKLDKAAEYYGQAAETLAQGFARYYEPELVAAPILQMGVALFQAGKKDEARRSFQRAVALVPGLQMSEGYYSPSVRRAFEKARTDLGQLRPGIPSPAEAKRISNAANLRALLVASIERLGDQPMLRVSLFDPGSAGYTLVETAVVDAERPAAAGEELAQRLGDTLCAMLGVKLVTVPPPTDGGLEVPDGGIAAADEQVDGRPWYVKHWWIWPVAAAVIGTAIALPLTVFRRDVVDINVY